MKIRVEFETAAVGPFGRNVGAAQAEHFAALGFTNIHNVLGGIDAWSQEIDPSVPRYSG